MRAITLVLESGSGPNLVYLRCVAVPLRSAIKPGRSPLLIDTSNGVMRALGELAPYIRIGELGACVPFLVVTNFAVDCIL